MNIEFTDLQLQFLSCFLLVLILSFIMGYYSKKMRYTRWSIERKLSIMDLEFPSSARYYAYIMTSLVRERRERTDKNSKNSIHYLRTVLYLDFIFIFPAYASVALACLYVSRDLNFMPLIFCVLSYSQGAALLLDIIENSFILKTIQKPKLFLKTTDISTSMLDSENEFHPSTSYFVYKTVVGSKWLIVSLGILGSLMAILYRYSFGEIINESNKQFIFLLLGIITLSMILPTIINSIKSKMAQAA